MNEYMTIKDLRNLLTTIDETHDNCFVTVYDTSHCKELAHRIQRAHFGKTYVHNYGIYNTLQIQFTRDE